MIVKGILFDYCGSGGDMTIPTGVTTIGDGVFMNCTEMTSVMIPAGVTVIGDGAFYGCTGLTSVMMADSVTSIGYGAFMSCGSLAQVSFGGDENAWNAIAVSQGNEPLLNAQFQYNAIIARIQDRIFKQKNRNHVLSQVMSQMQNGIIAVDQSMNVIFITSVAKKLLGIVGNPEYKNINDVSKDVKLDEVFIEAMRQGGVYTNDVAARTAVGRGHRPLRLYVSPMRQDDRVVGALAIVEDITELRRLEQVRTDFAANVSHELKTPLTSIRGFVETLQAGAIDHPEMAHKFLNIIMMETERLTRLINDILSISKLESGDDEVATERIRLDKKACDVCEMLSIHAQEKQVSLNYRLNSEPVYIIGNPDRVEQLLINLTENAIKYNKPGGSVTVQVFKSEQEANITISDTGIGIAEENLPRLFERFYRVDKGRSRQMGGTGLGLAIVKHIVRSMKGEIEVHSKLGEGTEFLITLPLAPKENPDKETIFDDEL